METYRFAAYLVSIIGPTAAILIFILSALPDSARNQASRTLGPRWLRRSIPTIIAVGLLIFGVRMLQLLSRYGTDIAIGALKQHDVERSTGQWFCALSIIGLAGILILVHHVLQTTSSEDSQSRWTWKAIAALSFLVTLQIPILYGYYVHTTEFPLVLATIGDDKQQSNTCGLLLFDTGTDVLVWNVHNAYGQVQQIPRVRLRSLTILGMENSSL